MKEVNEVEYKYFLEDLNYKIKSSYRSRNRIKLIMRLYMFLGLFSAIIGGLYFVLSFFKFEISSDQRAMLLLIGVGLLLSLVAKFYIEYLNEREKYASERKIELEKISNFIINWSVLERTLNKYIDFKKLSDNKFAIGRNIEIVLKEKVISNKDFLTLEKCLDLRNQIVHGNLIVTKEDIDKYSESLQVITDKIMDSI